MRIIVNADDFGYSADTVAATIDAFERGILSSATIMARMPATNHALSFARRRPQFSFGVHLTYVSDGIEGPVSAVSEVPDLVTERGLFRPSNEVRVRALLRNLPAAQLAREARAQVLVVERAGVPISHVDSHGHLHKFPSIRRALEDVLPEHGIRRMRRVQDVFFAVPWRSPTYWLGPVWQRGIVGSFRTTSHFSMPMGPYDPEDCAVRLLKLSKLRNAGAAHTLEVGVHPGGADWQIRDVAFAAHLVTHAKRWGHQIVGWGDV